MCQAHLITAKIPTEVTFGYTNKKHYTSTDWSLTSNSMESGFVHDNNIPNFDHKINQKKYRPNSTMIKYKKIFSAMHSLTYSCFIYAHIPGYIISNLDAKKHTYNIANTKS